MSATPTPTADLVAGLDALLDEYIPGTKTWILLIEAADRLTKLDAHIAAVRAALVIHQPNSQFETSYEYGYAKALLYVTDALEKAETSNSVTPTKENDTHGN